MEDCACDSTVPTSAHRPLSITFGLVVSRLSAGNIESFGALLRTQGPSHRVLFDAECDSESGGSNSPPTVARWGGALTRCVPVRTGVRVLPLRGRS